MVRGDVVQFGGRPEPGVHEGLVEGVADSVQVEVAQDHEVVVPVIGSIGPGAHPLCEGGDLGETLRGVLSPQHVHGGQGEVGAGSPVSLPSALEDGG